MAQDRGALMLGAFNQTFNPMSHTEKQAYNMQRDFNVARNMHMNIEREELQLMDEARELNINLDAANISGSTFLDIKKRLAVKRGGTEEEGTKEAFRAMNAGGMSWMLGDGGRRTGTNVRQNEDGDYVMDVLTLSKKDQRRLASGDNLNDLTARRTPLTFTGKKTAEGGKEAVFDEANLDKLYRAHSWNIKSKAGKQPSLAYLSGSEEVLTILENNDYLNPKQTDSQTTTMRGELDTLATDRVGTMDPDQAVLAGEGQAVAEGLDTDTAADALTTGTTTENDKKVITENATKPLKEFAGLSVSGKAEDSGLRGDALYASLPLTKKDIGGESRPIKELAELVAQNIPAGGGDAKSNWLDQGYLAPLGTLRHQQLNPVQEKYRNYLDWSGGKEVPFNLTQEEWDSLNPAQKKDTLAKSKEISNRNLNNMVMEHKLSAKNPNLPKTDAEQAEAQAVEDFWTMGKHLDLRQKAHTRIKNALLADPELATELNGMGAVAFAKKYMKDGFPPPPEVDKDLTNELDGETNKQDPELKGAIKAGRVDKIAEFIKNNPGAYKIGQDAQGRIIMGMQKDGGLARHYSKSNRAAMVAGILSNMENAQAATWYDKLDSFVEYGSWDTGTSTRGLTAKDFLTLEKDDKKFAEDSIRKATFQSNSGLFGNKLEDVNLLNYASNWRQINIGDADFSKAAASVQSLTMLAKHYGPASMEQINTIYTRLLNGGIKGQAIQGIRGKIMSLPFVRGSPDNEAFDIDPNMVAVKKNGELLTDPRDYKEIEYFTVRDAFNNAQRGRDVGAANFFAQIGTGRGLNKEEDLMAKMFAGIAVMNLSQSDWENNKKQAEALQ